MPKERVQKLLAKAGHGSRREIEKWLIAGRLTANDHVLQLGDKIDENTKIFLDGRPLPIHEVFKQACRVLLYHKPEGEVCSQNDPEGRPSVYQRLPRLQKGRWIMVGRLDIPTSGLLLFTTDGELAHRLMHPAYEIEREYAVRVYGDVSEKAMQAMLAGIQFEEGWAKFDSISKQGGTGQNTWYHVILKSGKYREVRRLWESQGLSVSRLIRIRFEQVRLMRTLKAGRYMDLSPGHIVRLAEKVNLSVQPYESSHA